MSTRQAEGWYLDPYQIHHDRWMSAGLPTKLVTRRQSRVPRNLAVDENRGAAAFPAIRAENERTIIAATGVSCRQQIRHGTGRPELHSLEVVWQALQPK